MINPVAPNLLSAKELAVVLHVHPKTVQKYAQNRIIPVIKITKRCVRFDLEKCLEALNRRTTICAAH
jgi:DNA-binding transcriptional regulator YhcF (GntR family)